MVLCGEGVILERVTVIGVCIGGRKHVISKATLLCIGYSHPVVVIVHQVEVNGGGPFILLLNDD